MLKRLLTAVIASTAIACTGVALTAATAPNAFARTEGASCGRGQPAAPAPAVEHVLNDVVYSSADDAWAVGSRSPSYAERYAAIVHWDGSTWTKIATPPTGDGLAAFGGVTMISADEGWAVGSDHGYFEGASSTLAMHWDGAAWTVVPTPDSDFENALDAVSGTSSADVWAVGASRESVGGFYDPLIEHWDGSAWTTITPPDLPIAGLTDVHALAPNDVWAVGFSTSAAVALHYDGVRWHSVRVPQPGSIWNKLRSVSVVATDDIWAVGTQADRSDGESVLVEHWNGSRWRVVAAPSPGKTHNQLKAVDARSPSDVWAVPAAVRRTRRSSSTGTAGPGHRSPHHRTQVSQVWTG